MEEHPAKEGGRRCDEDRGEWRGKDGILRKEAREDAAHTDFGQGRDQKHEPSWSKMDEVFFLPKYLTCPSVKYGGEKLLSLAPELQIRYLPRRKEEEEDER